MQTFLSNPVVTSVQGTGRWDQWGNGLPLRVRLRKETCGWRWAQRPSWPWPWPWTTLQRCGRAAFWPLHPALLPRDCRSLQVSLLIEPKIQAHGHVNTPNFNRPFISTSVKPCPTCDESDMTPSWHLTPNMPNVFLCGGEGGAISVYKVILLVTKYPLHTEPTSAIFCHLLGLQHPGDCGSPHLGARRPHDQQCQPGHPLRHLRPRGANSSGASDNNDNNNGDVERHWNNDQCSNNDSSSNHRGSHNSVSRNKSCTETLHKLHWHRWWQPYNQLWEDYCATGLIT